MNRRPVTPLILGLCLALLGAPCVVAAQSIEAAPANETPQAATTGSEASDATLAPQDQQHQVKAKDLHDSYCLQHTGSLIRQTGGRHRCIAIGSAYSRDDLQRTGATDIGDALRRLDSSIH